MRRCSTCKEDKSVDNFTKDSSRGDGISYSCKSCTAVAHAKYRGRNKQVLQERYNRWRGKLCPETGLTKEFIAYIKYKYGLTALQYVQLLDDCEGKCSICKEPLTKSHVDHDHITGTVRGILRPQCNMGLGLFKDSPERLEAAANYLRRLAL